MTGYSGLLMRKRRTDLISHPKEDVVGKTGRMRAGVSEGSAEGKFFRVFPGNGKFPRHSAVFGYHRRPRGGRRPCMEAGTRSRQWT